MQQGKKCPQDLFEKLLTAAGLAGYVAVRKSAPEWQQTEKTVMAKYHK